MIVEALEISASLWDINLEKWVGLFVFSPPLPPPAPKPLPRDRQIMKLNVRKNYY